MQVYTDSNDPKHIQVPVWLTFSEDENPRGYNTGLLDFFPGEGEEVPATGFTPKHEQLELTEGSLPLNQEMVAHGHFHTVGKLKPRAPQIGLGPEMNPDGSETGGLKLAWIPVKDIDMIKDTQAEYYLRDIYGNELILTDAVAVADREPLLKNLAFAEAKAENSTVTVTYGGETLNPDLDYMVYTKDGEILIQGVGEYAGSIVLNDGK